MYNLQITGYNRDQSFHRHFIKDGLEAEEAMVFRSKVLSELDSDERIIYVRIRVVSMGLLGSTTITNYRRNRNDEWMKIDKLGELV